MVDTDSNDDENESTELEDSGDDAHTESAEAELGKCAKTRVCFKIELTKLNRKTI